MGSVQEILKLSLDLVLGHATRWNNLLDLTPWPERSTIGLKLIHFHGLTSSILIDSPFLVLPFLLSFYCL